MPLEVCVYITVPPLASMACFILAVCYHSVLLLKQCTLLHNFTQRFISVRGKKHLVLTIMLDHSVNANALHGPPSAFKFCSNRSSLQLKLLTIPILKLTFTVINKTGKIHAYSILIDTHQHTKAWDKKYLMYKDINFCF